MSYAASFVAADNSSLQIADADQSGLNFSGSWTVCGSVYISSTSTTHGLFGKFTNYPYRRGYQALLNYSANLIVQVSNDGVALTQATMTGNQLTALAWHFVLVSYDDARHKLVLQIDGNSPQEFDFTGPVFATDAPFVLGLAAYYTNGRQAYWRAYSRLLTPSEIARQANMSGGVHYARPYAQLNAAEKDPTYLKGCWDCQDGPWSSTQQCMDLSGNGNHLTFTAANIINATNKNGGFETQTVGAELLSNTGFESYSGTQDDGVTDSFTSWECYTFSGGVIEATASCHSGTSAIKLWKTGGVSPLAISAGVYANAKTAYRLQFWARGDGIASGTYSVGGLVSGWISVVPTSSTGVSGTDWVLVTVDFECPADVVMLRVELGGPVGDGVAYFDDVSLKPLLPATWSISQSGGSKVQTELTAPYSGSYACRFDVDASNSDSSVSQTALTSGKTYTSQPYAKASSGTPSLKWTFGSSSYESALTTSYAQYAQTRQADGTSFKLSNGTGASSKSLYLDNVTLTAANLLTADGPLTTTAVTFLSGWKKAKVITIPAAYITGSLTNFPLSVQFTNDANIGAAARADGYDLRFTLADGTTVLPCYRRSFAVAGGQATGIYDVLVPSLTSGVAGSLVCQYGNASAPDVSNSAAVFGSSGAGYAGVWDFGDGVTLDLTDRTGNENNGTGASITATPGIVQGGVHFSGAGSWVAFPSTASLSLSGNADYAICGWVKIDTAVYPQADSALFSKWNGLGYMCYFTPNGTVIIFSDERYFGTGEGAFPSDGSWHSVMATKNGAAGSVFIDGALAKSGSFGYTTIHANAVPGNLNSYNNNQHGYIQGIFSDVRVMPQSLSAAFAYLDRNQIANQSSVVLWGDEVSAASSRRRLVRPVVRRLIRSTTGVRA